LVRLLGRTLGLLCPADAPAHTAIASEEAALPSLTALLRETFPPVEPVPGPGAGKGKKRKRDAKAALPAHHELFPPTPLSELVVDGMSAEQLWEQLELRGAKLERLLSAVVQEEEVKQDGDDEEDEEDMPKGRPYKAGAEDDSDEDEYDSEEEEEQEGQKLVHSIAELSDAEMRALGLDPAMRDEYMFMADGDSDGSDDDSEDHGYPGTSDLSDDDADEVSFEPLLSEKEQQARKAAAEAAELGRLRSETRQRRIRMGKDPDAEDSDEEDDDGMDPELAAMMDASYGEADEDEDDEEEEDDEEAGSGSESEEDPEVAEHRRRASILDNLDEPGSSVAGPSRKG
jgi:U3 small nucleolar RNA-associated protein MPP10